MCDFSQYDGPSSEWLAVQNTLPFLSFDMASDPHALKAQSNLRRETFSANLFASLAPQVHTATYEIPTRDGSSIRARSYRSIAFPANATLPVYLYFHDGGYVTGTLDSEDWTCAALAVKLPIIVLNVEYRHTPEFTFPTAWHDAQDAFIWLHKNTDLLHVDPAKVVIGGASAGGQLTASLVLEKHLGVAPELVNLPPVAGQILMIPCLAHPSTYDTVVLPHMASSDISSYKTNADAPLLSRNAVDFFINLLQPPPPVSETDTKLNIVGATTEQVKGIPPTVFGLAGLDPLRDEGLLYAKRLAEAGVPTDVRMMKGVPHGARRVGDLPNADRAWDQCSEEGIMWCLRAAEENAGPFEVKVVSG